MDTQTKGDAMPTRQGSANVEYRSSGVSMWCDDCDAPHVDAGAHVGDTPNSVLGLRGIASTITYAWCASERLYHYTSRRRAGINQVASGKRTERSAQPKRDVHTVRKYMLDDGTLLRAADVFISQYDAQRITHQ